ncbi:hypothetical protein AX279_18310 [Pseudomonas sp. J237]|nr:hypothetical protein AX279_18310 [Pseudomonas sp. J237]CRN72349.1 hypothetical protein PAERUG_P40_Scotland_4_VIM_2_09_12_04278 [Pseudomonas aeruginosa]
MPRKEVVFRRQLRIARPDLDSDLDARLIRFLEHSEAESTFKMQEWCRNALRRAFVQDQLAILVSKGDDTAEFKREVHRFLVGGLS